MESSDLPAALGPALTGALASKGYSTLTAVQTAVLDPALAGRDLRITSQTGSGKTVAVGFALRHLVSEEAPAKGDGPASKALARPRAIVIAPTRELARQFEEELTWLYKPLGAHVSSVTGGAGYTEERRSLSRAPTFIVGTPGRLLEHLQRGTIDASAAGAVVLDEADRLLDLGFREDLEAILAFAPEGHNTHLVSATFPRDVKALADKTQTDPVHVEGTRLGAANADIDHVIHLVDGRQRMSAIINLLLANPDGQTLVFARTRADVADIAHELKACGFAAMSLSGEMDQAARNRALSAFKNGDLHVLVATDVAARGIDVQDIARVVHAEPPTDADTYTHRSGRTGRAGRKGTSCILASPPELARTRFLLNRAGVVHRFEAIPSADAIRAASSERTAAALLGGDDEPEGIDEVTWALAKRIAAEGNVTRAIARLLTKARYGGPTEPRNVRVIEPPTDSRGRPGPSHGRTSGPRVQTETRRRHPEPVHRAARPEPAVHAARPARDEAPAREERAARDERPVRDERPARPERAARDERPHPRAEAKPDHAPTREARPHARTEPRAEARADHAPTREARPHRSEAKGGPLTVIRRPASHASKAAPAPRERREERAPRDSREPRAARDGSRDKDKSAWVPFRVSWGEEQGADPRRLLAVACRRGNIRGTDVGSIRVSRSHSVIEVASHVADAFAIAAGGPDPRDPRMTIRPERASARP